MSDRAFKLCVVAIIATMIAVSINSGLKSDSYRERCETLGGEVFYESPSTARPVCLSGFKKIKP